MCIRDSHCTVEHNLHAPSSGLVNNPVCAGIAREAYREAFGQDCILDAELQMGSETFALAAALWPSAFTCLGMRSEDVYKRQGLHHHLPGIPGGLGAAVL